ncbi:MAG: hypothetical protein GY935_19340 [Gammaproteobacteria bacterium]|nr:hypothetical protein [Gammaproteobacteria bacterium]
MLICDFELKQTRSGCLEFQIPGFGNTIARIAPWADGFDTFEIKYKRTLRKPLWVLEIFPHQAELIPIKNSHQFFSDIPPEIREQIRSFKFGQCAMLRWLARYPEARDLCYTNPKLLWLLTTAIFDSSVDEDELPQLLRKRQVEILARIFKPCSPSALRILHKVDLISGDLREARTIIRALKKSYFRKTVAHLPSISTIVLRTLYDHPDLVLPSVARLLTEEFRNPDCNPRLLSLHVVDTVRDIRRMAEVLGIENSDQAIERCRSLEALSRLRDRWVERVNCRQGLWLDGIQDDCSQDLELLSRYEQERVELERTAGHKIFSEPPFPDSEEVKAIRSVSELIIESRIQENCVHTYAKTIVNGEVYLYKVLKPHRATFELVKTNNGWEPGQLKLSRNRIPGPEVERVIIDWMVKHSQDLHR